MHCKLFQLLLVAFLTLPNYLCAQHNYFLFKYNKQYGLSNLDGTDVIEGNFTTHSDQIKNYALFGNKEKKEILIDLKTGKKEVFDRFDGNSIFLDSQYFANVERADKHFLWGQKTGEILPVPKALQGQVFQRVYMINKNFLYAVGQETVFPPQPKKKPVTRARTGTQPPPPIAPPERLDPPKQVTYVYVFKNERAMPLVTKIEVDEDRLFGSNTPTAVFDFYNLQKIDKEVTNDHVYLATERTWNPEIKPWHFYYDETFNIACTYNAGSFIVMDGNFKKITTIASEDRYDKDAIAAYFQSLYPDKEVRLDYAGFSPSVSMAGSARKPSWQVVQKDKIYEISYLKEDQYIPYLSAEAVEAKVWYDDKLYLKDENDNELTVELNRVTLQLPIPIKYKEQFKIQLL
ncbi:hypothetical protein [Sphingobacterium yanglingense]|uniref:DKNYY family protein n=1 Tax=Sphingobacterium yanglingense TaxID=1437280 RepID=A0A4R6WG77_9SPHI|nr:hypothetical protein [Sphingobacterium yanglingense]TDQ77167.1 hypothetical protein CLV99_2565 [Sphingobacterium yanglingense]